MSRFDETVKGVMLQTVKTVMGDTLTWTPLAGGDTQIAMVLYNDPTQAMSLKVVGGKDYYAAGTIDGLVSQAFFEYNMSELPGLKEAVDATLANATPLETVTIKGMDFVVKQIKRKWDGDVYIAYLEDKI